MSMTPRGWSISALAVELRMDRRTIAQRVADLKPIGETGRGQLYSLADVWAAMKMADNPAPRDFDDARTRKMAADAVLAEIEVAKARGDVLSVSVVERAASEAYAAVRAKLLGLPDKMTPLCRTAASDGEVRELLRRAVAEALEELSADDAGHAGFTGYADGEGASGARSRPGEIPSPAAVADGERVG